MIVAYAWERLWLLVDTNEHIINVEITNYIDHFQVVNP